MKNIFTIIPVAIIVFVAGVLLSGQGEMVLKNFSDAGRNIASVFFVESITVSGLQGTYANASYSSRKINILIVPGHEPNVGGTEFQNLKERDLNVDLADNLARYLQTNSRYKVTVARTKDAWNPVLSNYFDQNWDEIKKFAKDKKTAMSQMLSDGTISKLTDGVYHNSAPANTALRMYGINKWANENSVDITINIHFNDYPRRNKKIAGEYKGFSIYIPDSQYSNARATAIIAGKVFKRLASFAPVSNLPKEDAGIVPDQELIAVGSRNTADSASMLIEYGYVYEPWFQYKNTRAFTVNKMAYNTYLGIQDFFGAYDSVILSQN